MCLRICNSANGGKSLPSGGFTKDLLDARYVLRSSVAIEDFEEESLIFLAEERRLIKINAVTRDILNRLDGRRTVQDLLHDMAIGYGIPFDSLEKDVVPVLTELAGQRVIKDLNRLSKLEGYRAMDDTKYTINHDVSCRIEEPEGAILFNPETDAVQAINPTGLAIWQALEYPRNKQEIVEYLLDVCEDVPEEQVVQDVEAFVEKLKAAGFVGEVIE